MAHIISPYFTTRIWDNTTTRNDNDRVKLSLRRKRSHVVGFNPKGNSGVVFAAGDILAVVIERGPYGHFIEGICISVTKRSLMHPHTGVVVRNVIAGVGVEFTISYYYHRMYKLQMRDYKRKQFDYANSNKLYYLRNRDNKESRVRL